MKQFFLAITLLTFTQAATATPHNIKIIRVVTTCDQKKVKELVFGKTEVLPEQLMKQIKLSCKIT